MDQQTIPYVPDLLHAMAMWPELVFGAFSFMFPPSPAPPRLDHVVIAHQLVGKFGGITRHMQSPSRTLPFADADDMEGVELAVVHADCEMGSPYWARALFGIPLGHAPQTHEAARPSRSKGL
eukprot:1532565-Amphidinium_carterae.1